MKKVISIVLNNFVNDARVLKEAVTLLSAGYEVTVVCLHDEGLPITEVKSGVNVQRIKLLSRSLPKSNFFWGIKYLEFFFKAFFRFFRGDVIHCHDLNTLSVGYFIKFFRRKRVRLIYDAHEFETEQHENPGKVMYKLTVWLERILIKPCDAVITVSKPIAEAYAKRYQIPEPELILNCPPYQQIDPRNHFRNLFNINEETKILLYQGGLSTERGIENLLEAFHQMNDPGLALVVMGYGPLEGLVTEYSQKNNRIFLHPAVGQDVLASYTSSADFGLLFYENTCLNNYYCMPNKLFEYLMAGVPVVVSPLFELRRLVETYTLGVVSEDSSVEAIHDAMLDVLDFDLHTFKQRVEEFNIHYNWEQQARKLTALYAKLCAV
jgi:glycosyltransferase involved in cell wall biosynthesis